VGLVWINPTKGMFLVLGGQDKVGIHFGGPTLEGLFIYLTTKWENKLLGGFGRFYFFIYAGNGYPATLVQGFLL